MTRKYDRPKWVIGHDRREMQAEYNCIWRKIRKIEYVARVAGVELKRNTHTGDVHECDDLYPTEEAAQRAANETGSQ